MTNRTRVNLIAGGIGVLLAAIIGAVSLYNGHKRVRALTRWALANGLYVVQGEKFTLVGPVPSMRFFAVGPRGYFKEDVIEGEVNGLDFQAFDCMWGWYGRVDSKGGVYTDTVELFSQIKNLPNFELYPQHVPSNVYEPPPEPGAVRVSSVFISPFFYSNYMLVAQGNPELQRSVAATLRQFVEGKGHHILWWIQAKDGSLFLCNYTGELPVSQMGAFYKDGLTLASELSADGAR